MSTLILCIAPNTYAATQQSFTLPLTFEHDSNPRFFINDEKPVSRYSLAPEYSIRMNDGTEEWFTIVGLRLEKSSEQTISQDRIDPSLNIGWKHDYEIGHFSMAAILREQSTRISEFSDSGLVEYTDTGLISGDNTRKTRSLSIEWLNSLSERMSLTLNYDFTNVFFDGVITTGLVGYRNDSINSALNYNLSEKMETFIQLSLSQYIPDDEVSVSSTTAGFNLGIKSQVNEQLNVTASVGTSETINNDQSKSRFESSRYMFTMQYSTLQTRSNFLLSRSQSPGSIGIINEYNQLVVDWTYFLSDHDNITLEYGWIENVSLNNIEIKSQTVKYNRQISLAWDFHLSATHSNRDDKIVSVGSNSVMASIIYKLPDF